MHGPEIHVNVPLAIASVTLPLALLVLVSAFLMFVGRFPHWSPFMIVRHHELEAIRVPAVSCEECGGGGLVEVDRCTCGTGPSGYYGMHERYCGTEPCPAGCPLPQGE